MCRILAGGRELAHTGIHLSFPVPSHCTAGDMHVFPPFSQSAQDMSREDFPLPTLGPKLEAVRDEVILGKGFHLLRYLISLC